MPHLTPNTVHHLSNKDGTEGNNGSEPKAKNGGKAVAEKGKAKPKSSQNSSNTKGEKSKDSVSKRKQIIANEVLKRWWYVLPPWPPANIDYKPLLAQSKLREVRPEAWIKEANVDSNGFSKVQGVAGYPGCYRDHQGTFYDLRPKESCPSYENMISKGMEELLQLLLTALENQLKDLRSSDYKSEKLADKLMKMISRTNELVETKKEEND